MSKKIILFCLFLLFIQIAYGIEECKGTILNTESPCYVLLPVNTTLTDCSSLNMSIYKNSSINIYNQTMSQYTPFLCNATFNQTNYGTYTIYYSTGDSGSIIVEEDVDNRYYFYIIVVAAFAILLSIGLWREDHVFVIISGMLLIVLSLNLFFNGYPNLTNEFLKNGIIIVLAGIGFYLILAPTITYFENFGGMIGGKVD